MFTNFEPVILWTDGLVFLLVAAVIGFALHARGKEHLRGPWRQVLRSRLGMAATVVLLPYVLIAVLDSLHFRPALPGAPGGQTQYAAQVLSVFDVVVTPLREHTEKTYSAPFATHLFAKENVQLEDGRTVRVFPRLKFGGAHLANPSAEKSADILALSMKGIAAGLAAAAVCGVLVVAMMARRWRGSWSEAAARVIGGRSELPLHVMLATTTVVLVTVAWLIFVAGKYHVLGTDKVGQDVLYQALKSIRTGLVIGTLTTLLMLPFAVLLGVMAGYFKGWIDDVVQYVYTALNSIPGVLLIAAAVLMLQVYIDTNPDLFPTTEQRADMRLLFLCIILGVTSWTGLCRLLRGEALKLSAVDYIQSAAALGSTHGRIITRHIVPNVMHIVLISVVLDFSGLVLAEAVLSYVGVGVDPSMFSWGNMINSARLEMAREPMVWWSLAAAFLFMFILVLAANVLSDAVRDAFDPRLRKQ